MIETSTMMRQNEFVHLFARKRYQWDLDCEWFSQTASPAFFNTINELIFNFDETAVIKDDLTLPEAASAQI